MRELNNSTIKWPNVNFVTWPYQKQTEIKHTLLKKYLPVWLSILGKYSGVNYLDGFGGLGAYHNSDDIAAGKYISKNFGSPIIAIRNIYSLRKKKKINNAKVVIIDSADENLQNIQKIIEFHGINFMPIYVHGDFDKEINKILDQVEKSGKTLAPTFFFVDPFGFKIKHSTIIRLMQTPKSEVLINFMYTRINEFLSSPQLESTLNDLFGTDEWKDCITSDRRSREREIVKCYRDQFKKHGFYVVPYKFEFPEQRRTYYYLFHISQHYKGCAILKDISSKLASVYGGHMEFQSKKRALDLFSLLPKHKRTDSCGKFFCYKSGSTGCDNCIYEKFNGRVITYFDFRNEIIDEVPLTESGIKDALRELEENKLLEVIQGSSRKRERKNRGGFKEDDRLNFATK
ncbi:MAG: three-Cys-motif partner protein TcmP [Bacteroidales bacterium]|nr:three-Cys-motif partner protein TcmP [Bacteroidales bacterium]MCF8336412.1 three-Cys-motif partner protein TcmP [Bacteroidales bacterium]